MFAHKAKRLGRHRSGSRAVRSGSGDYDNDAVAALLRRSSYITELDTISDFARRPAAPGTVERLARLSLLALTTLGCL